MIGKSIWAVAFGVALLTVLSGCRSATPAVTYYTLNPISEPAREKLNSGNAGLIVAILPVELPGVIDRSQMVTRIGAHQLAVSALHRWADYPNALVQQILGQNLQLLMPNARVVSAPWPMGLKPDVTVTVKFYELLGTPGSRIRLNAAWTAAAADTALAVSRRVNLTEPVAGKGYKELAAAHSRILAAFCRILADSLIALHG